MAVPVHQPVLWMTGLSGAGKSAVATLVAAQLREAGRPAVIIDGDCLRQGLSSDLDFSTAGRRENVRRAAYVASLVAAGGSVAIVALMSPTRADRALAKSIVGARHFVEVYINATLDVCEMRDTKGLYRLARAGCIEALSGVNSPYEPPENPDFEVNTNGTLEAACAGDVIAWLSTRVTS